MENKEFFIDKDGFKLHAKLDFPKIAGEKMPVAIILHGLTGNMEEEQLLRCVSASTRAGMAALRVELYGHGLSDGNFSNHNVMEWVNETLFVIDYARKLEFASEIVLMGHSQGGLTAILAAGLKADQVDKLVLLSAATNIVDACKKGTFFDAQVFQESSWLKEMSFEEGFDGKTLPETITFWGDKVINTNYVRIGRLLPVEETIKSYSRPVLLVHGEKDDAVPVTCSIENAKQYKQAKLVLIPEDGHCYPLHPNLLEEAIYSFLTES